jgi:hypothetical protein
MESSEWLIPVFNAIIQNESLHEREVQLALLKALNTIRREMETIYDKYTDKHTLTLTEMAKYNRYADMEKQMMRILAPALKQDLLTIRNFLPEQYKEVFASNASTFENIGLNIVPKEVLTELCSITDEKNLFMNETLRNYSMDARKKIQQVLLDGFLLGESFDYMARDMGKTIDVAKSEALQLARTEGMAAMIHGTYDSYIKAMKMGVKGKIVWSAVKDLETRPSHRAMDGQTQKEDGFFHLPNGEITPFPHWEGLSAVERVDCRCDIIFEVDGFAPKFMRTRDFGIEPYLPYSQWYEKHYGNSQSSFILDTEKNNSCRKTDWTEGNGWTQEQENNE